MTLVPTPVDGILHSSGEDPAGASQAAGNRRPAVFLGAGAPATTATTGFPYIPTVAGAPTGTPTAETGYAPIVFDTTNIKLWVYDPVASAWKGVVLA